MFAYRLPEPIDTFDGLTPLHEWLTSQHPSRAAWALQAVLALAANANEVGWDGNTRHLPMIGGLPTLGRTTPYLVVKQDGAKFRSSHSMATSTTMPVRDESPECSAA